MLLLGWINCLLGGILMADYLQVRGLTPKQKEFLKLYAQKELGTPSRTKAILHLIDQAIANEEKRDSNKLVNSEVQNQALENRDKYIEQHQELLRKREKQIVEAKLLSNHDLLNKLYKSRVIFKKNRVQFSLPVYDFEFLAKLAKESNSSIQHYIIVILNDYLYGERKLLGTEIETLKKSNYELYKIGVNVNQIAKANNAGDTVELPINKLYNFLQKHITIAQNLLNKSTDIY